MESGRDENAGWRIPQHLHRAPARSTREAVIERLARCGSQMDSDGLARTSACGKAIASVHFRREADLCCICGGGGRQDSRCCRQAKRMTGATNVARPALADVARIRWTILNSAFTFTPLNDILRNDLRDVEFDSVCLRRGRMTCGRSAVPSCFTVDFCMLQHECDLWVTDRTRENTFPRKTAGGNQRRKMATIQLAEGERCGRLSGNCRQVD